MADKKSDNADSSPGSDDADRFTWNEGDIVVISRGNDDSGDETKSTGKS